MYLCKIEMTRNLIKFHNEFKKRKNKLQTFIQKSISATLIRLPTPSPLTKEHGHIQFSIWSYGPTQEHQIQSVAKSAQKSPHNAGQDMIGR